MAEVPQELDISNLPDLLRLAEEVQKSNRPQLFKRNGEELAVIMPVEHGRRKARRTGIITSDGPFVRMAGIGDSGIPSGISARKYDYFRKAFGVEEQDP